MVGGLFRGPGIWPPSFASQWGGYSNTIPVTQYNANDLIHYAKWWFSAKFERRFRTILFHHKYVTIRFSSTGAQFISNIALIILKYFLEQCKGSVHTQKVSHLRFTSKSEYNIKTYKSFLHTFLYRANAKNGENRCRTIAVPKRETSQIRFKLRL